MLKITSPVKLVNKNIVSKTGNGLFSRISDNYSLINADISAQDLLHVFNEPPQVFLAEGETTNVFTNNVNVVNTQKKKLEIVNNLINRILISNTADFSYQDRVYISSVLHKLGIKDEHQFLNVINSLIDENNLMLTQNRVLAENIENIRTVLNSSNVVENSASTSVDVDNTVNNNNPFYLHQQVLTRLNYSELANYVNQMTKPQLSPNTVETREIVSAETIRLANHLRLQQMNNELTKTETPMIYNHENVYEEYSEESVELDKSEVTQNLLKAMLVSYIDNLHLVNSESIRNGDIKWLNTSRNLYNTVDNSVKRYTQNLISPISTNLYNEFHDVEVENYRSVREGITNILSIINSNEQTVINNAGQTNIENLLSEVKEDIRSTVNVRPTQLRNESQIRFEYLINNLTENSELNLSEEQLIDLRNQVINEHIEDSNRYISVIDEQIRNVRRGDEINKTTLLENVNEVNITHNESNFQRNETDILNDLRKIEEHNIENRNQYVKALETIRAMQENRRQPATTNNRERQKNESLRALDNPQELLLQYANEVARDAEERAAFNKEAMQLLPPDIRRFVEIIDGTLVNPKPEYLKYMGADPLSALNEDIARIEASKMKMAHPEQGTDEVIINEEKARTLIKNIANETNVVDNVTNTINERSNTLALTDRESIELNAENIDEVFSRIHDERIVLNEAEAKALIENITQNTNVVDNVTNTINERSSTISIINRESLERNAENIDEVLSNIHDERITLNEAEAKSLIENITHNTNIVENVSNNVTEHISNMSFVHKRNVEIDEEEINERFEQLRNENRQNREVNNVVNETTTVTNKTEVTREIIDEVATSEQVSRMITANVSDQLSSLSEQVYQRLERRLMNEKRRRGL